MHLFVRPLVLAAALLLPLGACRETIEVTETNFGLIEVDATAGASAGQYVTRPSAAFFRAQRTAAVMLTTNVNDVCETELSFSETPLTSDELKFLDAGSVTLTFGATSATLSEVAGEDLINYRSPASVAFTPGDSVMATVGGGGQTGFPNSTLKAKTAEPFTFGAVGVPLLGQPLPLTWTPASDPNSVMTLSLRFAATGSTKLDRQLFCALRDDGSYTIQSGLLVGWINAQNGMRQAVAQRVRSTPTRVGTATLQIRSRFTLPVQITP